MSNKTQRNLKVIIDVDMEGISGIDNYHQILNGYKEFEEYGRIQITEDVNAAIRGARAAGATEIRVVDNHGSGGPCANIIPEKLEEGTKLYQGPDIWNRLREAVDKSFSAAFLIGFHAMADTRDGFITHTITIEPRLKINGKPVGETALAALRLGTCEIPVVMVTGDQALVREASELLPGVETVQVKASVDRRTTKTLPLVEARELIEKGAARAMSKIGKVMPFHVKFPAEIEMSFPTKDHAELAQIIPKTKRRGESTISYVAEDFDEGEAFINTALALATRMRQRVLYAELKKLKEFPEIEKNFLEKIITDWLSD